MSCMTIEERLKNVYITRLAKTENFIFAATNFEIKSTELRTDNSRYEFSFSLEVLTLSWGPQEPLQKVYFKLLLQTFIFSQVDMADSYDRNN